jgi:hypothetical protein
VVGDVVVWTYKELIEQVPLGSHNLHAIVPSLHLMPPTQTNTSVNLEAVVSPELKEQTNKLPHFTETNKHTSQT